MEDLEERGVETNVVQMDGEDTHVGLIAVESGDGELERRHATRGQACSTPKYGRSSSFSSHVALWQE